MPASTTPPALDLSALSEENEKEANVQPSTADVPEEVKAFVDRAHAHWKDRPKKWREIELPTAEAVAEVRKLAKKFARATDRTFRERKQDNPTVLHYKVTDKVARDEEATEDSENS